MCGVGQVMTTIEKKIYHLLQAKFIRSVHRDALAVLYAQALSSSHRVYSRIDWDRLQARIKERLGQRGLDYVKREALKRNQ